jgi:hypothetical protein
MDIKQFLLYHKKNGTLDSVMEGVEKSTFVDSNPDVLGLVKPVLNKLNLENCDESKTDKKTEKKQSFCTEFNQMNNNILALLGFEFSKYLFFIFGVKHIAKKFVEKIPDATSYSEILEYVT